MKKLLALIFIFSIFALLPTQILAQRVSTPRPPATVEIATESAEATVSATTEPKIAPVHDVTTPQEVKDREEFVRLFSERLITDLSPVNFFAYMVQIAVLAGVPANTIILILMLPILATLIAFVRHMIGLPSLEMIVPIALSITLLSTGITAGGILLLSLLFAATLSRIILQKIRIMQLPKMALSVLVVALVLFISLTAIASIGLLTIRQISIFPILLLIILSDKIVALQLRRGAKETLMITSVTLILGIIGYFILSSDTLRNFFLLYPELLLILIPINILMGRYFGLRLTESLRFANLRRHVNK